MSSEIKVSSVKAKDGTAGISIADSTGNVSFNGEVNKFIGPNTYWASGSISQVTELTTSVYYNASTHPYVVWNTGSDASVSGAGNNFVQGTNTDDLKFRVAGIYLILCTFNFQHSSSNERAIYVTLRDTDNSDATLAVAKTQVSYLDSNVSRATATLSYIGKRDANSQTNITMTSSSEDDASLDSQSFLNYYLLQRTAS